VDSAVVRFEADSLRLLMLDMAIGKLCKFVKFMLAESVYKGVLDNGNFREFLHGVGDFLLSKREFPVVLDVTMAVVIVHCESALSTPIKFYNHSVVRAVIGIFA